jgi:predicted nucleic acid-binding Zn ribbon protein
MSRRGRGTGPVALGDALREMLRRMGISRPLAEYDVLTSWEECVGEQVAKVSTPERIVNGVLFVHVASAPWRAELSLRRAEIVRKINSRAGTAVVRDIQFR